MTDQTTPETTDDDGFPPVHLAGNAVPPLMAMSMIAAAAGIDVREVAA